MTLDSQPSVMQKLLSYWPIAVGIAVVYLVQNLWISLSVRRRARALGCKPVLERKGKYPLGIDLLARAIKFLKKNEFLIEEVNVVNSLGNPTTFKQSNLGTTIHLTNDPENIKAILATQFKDFELGPLRYKVFEPLLGKGIFTSDGQDWSHSRALLRPQFARTQISDLQVEENHVQHLFNRFERDKDGWTTEMDLAPLFFNLTLDSATEFLFGTSVNTQPMGGKNGAAFKASQEKKGETEDWSSFGACFDRANVAMSIRFLLADMYFLHAPKSMKEDCAEVRRFADYYVDRALARDSEKEDEGNYVFLHELVKETRDPYVLRSQLLNILIAGRDTTAGLLGWAMLQLSRHPDTYAKLRASVLADFGPYSEDPSAITFETLKANTCLQHVMNETLRLHPSVPNNFRRAVRDTTLPRGGGEDYRAPVFIREGQTVAYSTNVMHRRKDIWGEDAGEFRPDRWEGRKVGWEFLPFNGGPRICLGQQFALTEAGYVLVRLVQRYDKLENLDTEDIIRSNLNVTSSPVRTQVRMHEASASA